MLLREAVEKFCKAKEGIINPNTIKWYRYCLKSFVDAMGDRDIHEIDIDMLRVWRHDVLSQGFSEWTNMAWIKSVHVLFNWLLDERKITENPARRLELPKHPRSARRGIDRDDQLKMLEAARIYSRREYAMLLFAADTACRNGGLANLKIENLMLSEHRAYITEKGEKTRAVYFTEITAKALADWLVNRAHYARIPGVTSVFISTGGRNIGAPLSGQAIDQIFIRIAQRAGVTRNFSPHQWRHASARAMLRNGASLQHVSQILGHTDIGVTSQFYASLTDADLQAAHDKFSPLNDYHAAGEADKPIPVTPESPQEEAWTWTPQLFAK